MREPQEPLTSPDDVTAHRTEVPPSSAAMSASNQSQKPGSPQKHVLPLETGNGTLLGVPMTPGRAHIARIPSPSSDSRLVVEKIALQRENTRLKNPHNALRMSTVTVSARGKNNGGIRNSYDQALKTPRKVLRLDEALSARPPLQPDMEGPTPWSYSPHNRKPLNETNSPAWSFGRRTFVEKAGGSRTSWEKTWFQNSDVWSQKANFHSDRVWPAPSTYKTRTTLGPRQTTVTEFPAYSIGVRRGFSLEKKGSEKEPSPCQYDKTRADVVVLRRAPSFTHQHRRRGTVLWGGSEKTPAPDRYTPQTDRIHLHKPAFTI